MNLSKKIIKKEEKIAVIGLGYVGLPLAVAFSKKASVIGFDTNFEKIQKYKNGIDVTEEVGNEELSKCEVKFTSDEKDLKDAKFFVIAVSTPIKTDKTPDLTYIKRASRLVGKHLSKGSIVVYESTVYPGVTEDICKPILEEESNMVCGIDFKIAYSPERINPGDRVHRLENIKKIVSAMDEESLNEVAEIYGLIINAGVHKVSNIKTAEAIKVAENSQRDINIAFMNELSMVFDKMDIDTFEVVEAMNTKWNALGFYPGLVGGHCISVDPYYFIYKAEKLGYHSQIILSGRKINQNIPNFIVASIIKKLIQTNKFVKESKVVIMGITFKEDCNDLRNSKVEDIVQSLAEYGIEVDLVDPNADPHEVFHIYGKELTPMSQIKDADCIVFAVSHKDFKKLSYADVDAMYKDIPNEEKVLIDVKHILDKDQFKEKGYIYWSL